MTEIGRELRQAREAAGRSLQEISGATMVSMKHLRALELEDWNAFPGEVYLKGALRKYAGEVGVDPGQAVAWYEATKTSRLIEEQAVQELVRPLPERRRVVRTTTRRLNWRRLLLVLSVPVLAVLLIRFASSRLAVRENVIQPTPSSPPVTAPVVETPPVQPEAPQKPPEPEAPSLRIERDPTPGVVAFYVYGAESLQADLSFSERCWIAVTIDGRRSLQQNFAPGQTHRVQATGSIRLRIGYPPGLAVTLNGLPLELPAGAQPYTLEINRQ
jgi:cytoskeletal protein RodZ